MSNHVHIIAVPQDEDGLRFAIGETHRRYTRKKRERINFTRKREQIIARALEVPLAVVTE